MEGKSLMIDDYNSLIELTEYITGKVIILIRMLSCCDSHSVDSSIMDKIEPCRIHGKPSLFVCLNHETCLEQALFCTDCVDMHKGHKWETVQQFFTPEVKQLLEPDQAMVRSDNGQTIKEILEELARFKARLEYKLLQLQNQIEADYQKFQKKVSQSSQDPLIISEINNRTMVQIIKLLQKQRKTSFVRELREESEQAIKITQQNIGITLEALKNTISGHDWQFINRQQRQKMFATFSTRFKSEQSVVKQKQSFRFSKADKSEGICVSDTCFEAQYKNQAILKPAVACNQLFTPLHNKVGFKVLKLQKMAFFFDKSVIYIGVCMVELATSYKFLNLYQPSHGAYFIGSNGLSYHSKLPQYDKKNAGFDFGIGDVIIMWIDYKEGSLNFKKNKSNFSMNLGLNQKFLRKLTPCVMFSGQEGPSVKILTQQQLFKAQK